MVGGTGEKFGVRLRGAGAPPSSSKPGAGSSPTSSKPGAAVAPASSETVENAGD